MFQGVSQWIFEIVNCTINGIQLPKTGKLWPRIDNQLSNSNLEISLVEPIDQLNCPFLNIRLKWKNKYGEYIVKE